MAVPAFNSQKDLETYLELQNQRRSSATRTNVFLWKRLPFVVGLLAFGVAVMFGFPGHPKLEQGSKRTQEQRGERFDTLLSWLGVDAEKHKLRHQDFLDRLKVDVPDRESRFDFWESRTPVFQTDGF